MNSAPTRNKKLETEILPMAWHSKRVKCTASDGELIYPDINSTAWIIFAAQVTADPFPVKILNQYKKG